MKDVENKRLQYKKCHFNQENSPCISMDTVSIFAHKKKVKIRKKYDLLKYGQHLAIDFRSSQSNMNKTRNLFTKHTSLPDINKRKKFIKKRTRSSDTIIKKNNIFNSKFIVNRVSGCYFRKYLSPLQNKWKVYRCRMSSQDDSCCNSCNSDALFEVMKSLYDCYKKKKCNHCNCKLCGHLPREERRLKKERKAKLKELEKALRGKCKAQKEKNNNELIKTGEQIPGSNTICEKAFIQKVKAKCGFPPAGECPKTAPGKARKMKTVAVSVTAPLEGKKTQAELEVPCTEGRAEKDLIQKVKTAAGVVIFIISDYCRPLLNKALTRTESIITERKEKESEKGRKQDESTAKIAIDDKELAEECTYSLLTESEKETAMIQSENRQAAKAAVFLTPLEAKTAEQNDKILKGRYKIRANLGQTKIRASTTASIITEKLRKAEAAGFLTPLEGKTPEEKKEILKRLVKAGFPMPKPKIASKKDLVDKKRRAIGLQPEPKTSCMKEKYKKAQIVRSITPLQGKCSENQAKTLKRLLEAGIPLPEGRTPSEKSMINRIKAGLPTRKTPSEIIKTNCLAETRIRFVEGRTASENALISKAKAESKVPTKITVETIRQAKAAGLLTPLKGKCPKENEKILKGLVEKSLPLPEPQTASDNKIMEKIRKELGLPPDTQNESDREKIRKAHAAGIITSCKSNTRPQEKRIIMAESEAESLLTQSRTASEKVMTAKKHAKLKKLPSRLVSKPIVYLSTIPPEKQTKLNKKTAKLRKAGNSNESICRHLKHETERDKSPSEIPCGKIKKVKAAGLLIPLEGKSAKEKETKFRSLTKQGLQLPEAKTASEKTLIAKVKAENKALIEKKMAEQEPSKVQSEKLHKAKATGLLTPLEGKTPCQKDTNIQGRAEARIPLPEGKAPSEKPLIPKSRMELSLSPPVKTASEKVVAHRFLHCKAKAEGLLTPLAGKSTKVKERMLKCCVDARLPLREGKSASKKETIKKVRTAVGLSQNATPSEKRGETKTKSKKKHVSASKKLSKAADICGEYEDIIKTTTCDRGCRCDKKKIRFKHSYVKIRVTSPDISSLRNECLPDVKTGTFIDNPGIKITVARVDGVSSYISQFSNHVLETPKNIITLYDRIRKTFYSSNTSIDTVDASFDKNFETNDLKTSMYDTYLSVRYPNNEDTVNNDLITLFTHASSSYNMRCYKTYKIENGNMIHNSISHYEKCTDSDRYTSRYAEPSDIFCTSYDYNIMASSSCGSLDSVQIIKTESSLSSTTNTSEGMDVISMISLRNSSYCVPSSTYYLYCSVSDSHPTEKTVEESERFTKRIDYSSSDDSADDSMMSKRNNLNAAHFNREHPSNKEYREIYTRSKQSEYINYRLPQTKISNHHNTNKITTRKTIHGEPVVVLYNFDSAHNMTMVNKILSKVGIADASSIFVVVPTSDESDLDPLSESLSTICIQLSEHYTNWKPRPLNIEQQVITSRRSSSARGLKISAKGKKYCLEMMQEFGASFHSKEARFNNKPPKSIRQNCEDRIKTKNKICQITTPKQLCRRINHGVSTDTTADRPCCCTPKKLEKYTMQTSDKPCVANVVSELITPLLVKQGLNCAGYRNLTKISVMQQASIMSMNRHPSTVRPCEIPSGGGCSDCHPPSDMYEFSFCTPMPSEPPMSELDSGLMQSQPCQCDPEKIKQLLEQEIKAEKLLNMKSVGCGGGGLICHTGSNEDCVSCSRPQITEEIEIQGTCCGKKKKKKSSKRRSLCPCEYYQPVPKTGSPCAEAEGITAILGPAGGISQIEPEATCTQAAEPASCKGERKIKKKNNVIPKCPPEEPTPEPVLESKCDPVPLLEPEAVEQVLDPEPKPDPLNCLDDSNQWVDEKQVMRDKSDMTLKHSGFKMSKKKKPPPPPEEELTVEDIIRYYAAMNPDLLKDLCPPSQEIRQDAEYKVCTCKDKLSKDCACQNDNPDKKGVGCTCCPDLPLPPTEQQSKDEEKLVEEDEGPLGGFKLSIVGKGSGSKGLSGLYCFEMIQKAKISREC